MHDDAFGAPLSRRAERRVLEWEHYNEVLCKLGFDAPTDLLHDASFPLRKGDMPTRLVTDELYLNLAALASTLIVVVVIVVIRSALALSLDAATLGGSAIAVRIVEVAGRRLVVLISDVGHCLGFSGFRVLRYHEDRKSDEWWRCCFEPWCRWSILDLASSGGQFVADQFVAVKPGWAFSVLSLVRRPERSEAGVVGFKITALIDFGAVPDNFAARVTGSELPGKGNKSTGEDQTQAGGPCRVRTPKTNESNPSWLQKVNVIFVQYQTVLF